MDDNSKFTHRRIYIWTESTKGWGTFVIGSLEPGESITIVIPLIEGIYSSNLKNKFDMGLSGILLTFAHNNNLDEKTQYNLLTDNTSRIEGTFQSKTSTSLISLQPPTSYDVLDVYNISGIPSGACSGHLNKNRKRNLWY